ncbi:MAG: hypothetical protein FWC69_02260, partial [Defluviitaleaceae bacterium]|nr:hypothetical protein [Defluviitaleaceae bacterium]
DAAHQITIAQIEAIGAEGIEWNNQNFTGISFEAIADYLNINLAGVTAISIVADNDTEREVGLDELAYLYIAIAEEGRTPETDNHFVAIMTNDTNNQRRLRGLAYVNLEAEAGNYILNIEINNRSYGVSIALLEELGAEEITARGRNFTATPMASVIEHFNINLDGIVEGMVIAGGDGFSQPFTAEELLDYTNFFLAFEEDGVALEAGEGGSNIMSVFAHDERATRGVRGVVTIRLLEATGGDAATAIEGLEDGEFVIFRGEQSWTITMDELVALGVENFSSNIGANTRHFSGVRLTAVLEAKDISLAGATNFITTSWDSTFQAGWNIATDLDDIFIVIAEDGEALSPHNGPFFGVVQDRGANFNPRNLQSIRIN